MCEAMINLYESTHDLKYLIRAAQVARKLCVELAPSSGRVIEHYGSDWIPDPEKNKDADTSSEEYIFRPYGFQPGHAMEWSKLIVIIERNATAAGVAAEVSVVETTWMIPTAEALFEEAIKCGWDAENGGGLVYTYGEDGAPLDKNKYYWVSGTPPPRRRLPATLLI